MIEEKKYTIQFILFELLLISQVFLARTTLKEFQVFSELTLGVFMLIQIWKTKLTKKEEYLVIIFLISSLFSFIFNDILTSLLNFKIFALSILSIIYFTRVNIKMKIINIVMWVNIFLFIYQYFTGVYLMSGFLDQYGRVFTSDYPRPIGFFLSPHESAYLMGIFVLFILKNTKTSFLGIFPLFITLVGFVNAAYIIQIINNNLSKNKVIKYIISRISKDIFKIILAILFILFTCLIFIYSYNLGVQNAINNYEWPFLSNYFDLGRILGLQIIIEQVLSINTYMYIFAIIPRSYEHLQGDSFSTLNTGNEVMFFQLMQQGGIILFLFFLYLLLKNTNGIRLFILIGLLHYGDVTTPLAICMLLTYTYKMNSSKLFLHT